MGRYTANDGISKKTHDVQDLLIGVASLAHVLAEPVYQSHNELFFKARLTLRKKKVFCLRI